MTRPIDLVLPDSGPLISLARADRLDLLDLFDRPIIIADIVRLECLKKPTSPDHATLRRWFNKLDGRARIVETPMRGPYESALSRERNGTEPRATEGMGEATITYMLRRLDLYTSPDSVPVVLIEDRPASRLLGPFEQAHILSTRSWLTALELAGVIPSARDVINAMAHAGRELSSLQIDRPGRLGTDRTSFTDQSIRAVDGPRREHE